MKYRDNSMQRMAAFIVGACLLFFILYAVYFYMVEQSDVIALAHFIKSGGDTSEHRLVPALLGMMLSLLPSLVLLKLFHFPLGMKATALLPSYVLLGLLSATAPESVSDNQLHTPMLAAFMLMAVSAVIITLALMVPWEEASHRPVHSYLVSNVIITCLGVVFSIGITCGDRQLHEQLKVERLASEGRWEEVLETANNPSHQTRGITAMHAFALSQKGMLADELFTIPGLTGSSSLLPDTSAASRLFGSDRMVYHELGAVPARGANLSALSFLKKALEHRMAQLRDSTSTPEDSIRSRILIDYYLCSLLLDRKLVEFTRELPRFYAINDSLPRHYREACIMFQRHANVVEHPLVDEATTTSFRDFLKIMSQNKHNKALQRRACRDMYDGTYWVYLLDPLGTP